jgi:hypothetical protein
MSITIKLYNYRNNRTPLEYTHYEYYEIHNKLIQTILMNEIKSKVIVEN